MKINHITARNFIGARSIDIAVETPVVVFGGLNHSGKSSLKEAVAAAIGGDVSRIALKKDYGQIVTEGQKRAEIVVETDAGEASLILPDGKHSGINLDTDFLPFVTDPAHFAAQSDADRRTLLFRLTKLKMSGNDLKAKLIERGSPVAKIDAVIPLIHSGFPAACEYAKDEAKKAKGSWKAVTGENWGSDKSEGWTAAVPTFDAGRLSQIQSDIQAVEKRLSEHTHTLGILTERKRAYDAHQANATTNADRATQLVALQAKLTKDEQFLAEAVANLEAAEQRAGAAPRDGLVHDLGRSLHELLLLVRDSEGVAGYHLNGEIAKWDEFDLLNGAVAAHQAYIAQYGEPGAQGDADARARLPELQKAVQLMTKAVANDKRDIAAAEAAAEALKLSPDVAPVLDSELDAVRTSIDANKRQLEALRTEAAAIDRAKLAAAAAADNTKKAAAFHADVVEWLALAAALAPDGLPGEMLAAALKPVNEVLQGYAEITGWKLTQIDVDMSIRADGRPYRLLSESEKWRCDAMIAVAIATLSGLKFVLLDRCDVLDLPARGKLFAWIDTLAFDGDLDSALLFATLKAIPTASLAAYDTMAVHWIADGVITESSTAAVAA